MIVLVDTPIWSLAFRRSRGVPTPESRELVELIRVGHAAIIGPIRQELLSGVKSQQQFELLRNRLRSFPDLNLTSEDFELAAEYYNQCRTVGIQGSNTDFLICAAATRRNQSIFTTDKDFATYQKAIPVALHQIKM